MPSLPEGLCDTCVYRRVIRSDRGSTFYLCERSKTDPAFAKYPRLPVLRCPGHRAAEEGGAAADAPAQTADRGIRRYRR